MTMLNMGDCSVEPVGIHSPSAQRSKAFLERLSDPIAIRVRKTRGGGSSSRPSSNGSTCSRADSRASSCSSSAFHRDSFASAFPSSPAAGAQSPSTLRRASALLKGMTRSLAPQAPVSQRVSVSGKMKSSASTASSGSPRPVAVPHTITERHGGKELWVTAPMVAGELEKQGFRWRKKWKPRFVELNSRMLSYYELAPGGGAARKARRRAQLSADAVLEDLDERSFAVTPAAGERPWVLRAKDAATKLKWCRALTDCIDILAWLQHYELGALLGVGGNGVVHEITDKRTGRRFAVKSVDVAKFRNRAAVVGEVEILRSITNDIKHPNLVRIHKVYEEHDKIYLILDLCEGGELYDRIVARGRYGERDAARVLRQLASALQALHAHNILHLDVKPENILFASAAADAEIVLTDFGLARMVNGRSNPLEAGASMAGTVGYIAPEVISAHAYSPAADVFSAGVILFILLVGYPPFQGDSEVEILLKIARGDLQFRRDDWAHVSGGAQELVARMLAVRADERISLADVLAHPWLRDGADDRELARTMERLQRFNFERRSENMGSFMSAMLCDASEADYKALADAATVGAMIRQLSPSGGDRIPLTSAHVLARGLGLSPFVDDRAFVAFLDRDGDGAISADDFCAGVAAVRACDASFAAILFAAMLRVLGRDGGERLERQDFVAAFERLQCPEPLSAAFFKAADAELGAARPESDGECEGDAVWSVDGDAFAALAAQHTFIARLFLRTAKDNVTHMVKSSRSVEVFPRILED